MTTKKICFVTTIPGTISSFIIPTAKMLYKQLGMEITFICDIDQNFAESLPDYIRYIPISMKRGIDLYGIFTICKLVKIFKENKFDIIQYSTPNAALYASVAAKIAKTPIRLYGQWGIRYVGFTGIARQIFKYIEKFTCSNSTHVRAVSPMNLIFGIKEGLYRKSKVKVIGNGGTIGVDLEKFRLNNKTEWRRKIRTQLSLGENNFVYGFCGRVSADKGCAELLRAFKKTLSENNQVHLLIIGNIEKNHGIDETLYDWAKESSNVHFCGSINSSFIAEYYSAMDVLIHPTYREGFGMVIQEAGAMSVPVITTRIPGASEVMVDGESCILVKSKDDKQLTEAMSFLASNRGIADQLGQNAYERTIKLYARNIKLDNQFKDYKSLLIDTASVSHIILTEIDLWNIDLPEDSKIIKITSNTIAKYEGDSRVIAIVGSRGLAAKAVNFNFPKLRLFQLTSAGFDNVPINKYAENKVMVANAGTTYSTPISETVIFGLLQFAKRIHTNPINRKIKLFRHYDKITELESKKVLILGAGNIGTSIANKLLSFEMTVDAYDPFCPEKPQYNKIIRNRRDLLKIAYDYDYIISTLPDTLQTKNFINKELLDEFSSNAVFVNVGRKTIYNEDDLYHALKHKRIKGAVLDIFQKIPNPFTNKFKRLSNVIVWPGLSAISIEVKDRLNSHILANLCRLLNNEDITNIIN